jgi:hypothetical protein
MKRRSTMKRLSGILIVGAIAGLVAGYLIFGKMMGSYVSLSDLLPVSEGGFLGDVGRFAQNLTGISEIRRNILLSGAAGAGVAAGASVLFRRK